MLLFNINKYVFICFNKISIWSLITKICDAKDKSFRK